MKRINKEFLLIFLISIFLALLIFWKFFLKGLCPFPGDFLLAWFEPWKSDFFAKNTITIAHKPIADDVFRQIYPFKLLAADLIRQFQWPLWNPYNGAGMPLMATMHVGFLTPFNAFFLFLPSFLAWTVYIAIQPFLIGFFTYLYCRKILLSQKGAVFSSLSFMFSGFVIARLIFGEYLYTLAGLPLILYLIESFIKNPYSKIIFILPFVILFLFVSGQPQVIFYILLFVFFYVLYRLPKRLFFLLFLFLIGVGLAGVQLVPTLELFWQASISTASSKFIFDRFLLPVQHLITILIPNYFGNQATYNYWGAGDYIETIAAIGIIPCFFAYIAFIKKPKVKLDLRNFFLISVVLTILSTLDWFGPRLFFSLPIPLVSTGVPSRIFMLTTFSLAILGGYGFDNWLSYKKISKNLILRIFFFVLLVSFLFLTTFLFYKMDVSCHNKFVINCRLVALRNTVLEVSAFSLCLFVFFVYLLNKKRFLTVVLPLIVLLLVLVLGLYNSNKFLPFSAKETFLPENSLTKIIKKKALDGRIFGFGQANIKADFATLFRFYDPNYYDPLYNRRYGELISFANNGKILSVLPRSDVEITNELMPKSDVLERRKRLLDLLGVNYLIFKKSEIKSDMKNSDPVIWEDNHWYLKENSNVLPRAYLVNKFEVINEKQKLLKRLFDPLFNPKTTVLLEKSPSVIPSDSSELPTNKVTFKEYRENKVVLEAISQTAQILVLSDNYYPGWKAFIDDKEVTLHRANYTFRGIFLPKGHHIVKFSYQPLSLRIGLFISLFSGFVYLLIILFGKKITGDKDHRKIPEMTVIKVTRKIPKNKKK